MAVPTAKLLRSVRYCKYFNQHTRPLEAVALLVLSCQMREPDLQFVHLTRSLRDQLRPDSRVPVSSRR
jgi:hypothetical protein